MQIQIVHGNFTDGGAPDFRTAYPRNLVPVPKQQGISNGYLRPADGIVQTATGQGYDRGAINWNGVLYRVSGSKLIRVNSDDSVNVLGDVGPGGPVCMDYSFDRLGIASGGRLFFWNGSELTQVTDPDLGNVLSMRWIAGRWLCTDGTYLVVTSLTDQAAVDVTAYGSAEADPDPIYAVDTLRVEAYAFGRYSVEIYQLTTNTNFPWERISGAQVTKGILGSDCYCSLGDTFMFLGSGRNEAPAVYQMIPGNVSKVSTREIDQLLLSYSDADLAAVTMESRVDKNHQLVYLHLPDQTLVYDTIGSQAAGEPLWHTVDSGVSTPARYRAKFMVWCYGRWNVGDPTSNKLGVFTSDVGSHWGADVGWQFGTQIIYTEGQGAVIHELELVALTGRIALGKDPVVWTSWTIDGQEWSEERAALAGRQGERTKRICWRRQGMVRQWRAQRFRGTTEAHLSFARLEAQVEPLFLKGRRV